MQAADSLSADDRAVWRTIRKELEEIGISVAAFDAIRKFIFDWLVRVVETRAFEEQNEYFIDGENNLGDEQDLRSDDEPGGQATERQIEDTESESLGSIREDRLLARPQSSRSALDAEPNVPERGPKASDQSFARTRKAPKHRTRVPRVAALLASMSRPRR